MVESKNMSPVHKLTMQHIDKMFLLTHTTHNISYLRSDQLKDIARDEWRKMTDRCPSLQKNITIDINFDYSLDTTGTLAWNTHAMSLKDGALTSTRNDMIIGVNPNPTNGWFYGENCTDISFRYDLRSVLRHEFLHGLGVSSSIYKTNDTWTAGHNIWGSCYPTQYDTHIVDKSGKSIVHRCDLTESPKEVFLNGVRLFNPDSYNPSSFSHHYHEGGLMYWKLSPMKCMDIREDEIKMLSALGVRCLNTEPDQPSVVLLLAPLVLSLFLPLL